MTWAAAVGSALVLGVGVPWLGIRMIAPVLARGRLVSNYRGNEVFTGLGIAWLLWAASAIIGGVVIPWLLSWPSFATGAQGSVVAVLVLAGPLALVAFAVGMVDDTYGSAESRGFRGHLDALAKGHLTTGMLKLIGISVASLVVALVLSGVAPWADGSRGPSLANVPLAVVAGASIALTSNFVNLTDLRPGRALKVYCVLGIAGVCSAAFLVPTLSAGNRASSATVSSHLLDAAVLALFVVGPVLATWRYDLGERGMLGDAGANPMGAVAGMLIVIGLPVWALVAYFVVLLTLNLSSERVSFSRVIENNALLGRLDRMGVRPAEDSSAGETD